MSTATSFPPTDADEPFMRMALELAERGRGFVEPNPMVGCVIVRDGQLLGSGFHRRFGGAHAEVEALGSLSSPLDAKGATAYVTLEPCCHHGKTPPCSDALIKAGIAKVVVAMEDPFAQVAGGGLQQLKSAGIETVVGLLGDQARQLNAAYLKRVQTARPWVIAKWAMTIDGRIATVAGESQWITGPTSRGEVHRWRGLVDAIAVGMGTVLADDPLLTARPAGPRVATRVVFCRHRLPAIHSKLVQSASEAPLMLVVSDQVSVEQRALLQAAGATLIEYPSSDPVAMVRHATEVFGSRGMTNVMIEGGGELLASFFSAGQVDECHVYVGAKAFGGVAAPGPIAGQGVESLAQAWRFQLAAVDQFDDDVRLIYRREGG